MHVDAPSSTMHQCTMKFQMDTDIWKAMVEGMRGSPFFMSNLINLDSEGSTTPRVTSKDFCYVGNVLSTSRADMEVGI